MKIKSNACYGAPIILVLLGLLGNSVFGQKEDDEDGAIHSFESNQPRSLEEMLHARTSFHKKMVHSTKADTSRAVVAPIFEDRFVKDRSEYIVIEENDVWLAVPDTSSDTIPPVMILSQQIVRILDVGTRRLGWNIETEQLGYSEDTLKAARLLWRLLEMNHAIVRRFNELGGDSSELRLIGLTVSPTQDSSRRALGMTLDTIIDTSAAWKPGMPDALMSPGWAKQNAHILAPAFSKHNADEDTAYAVFTQYLRTVQDGMLSENDRIEVADLLQRLPRAYKKYRNGDYTLVREIDSLLRRSLCLAKGLERARQGSTR